MQAMPKNAFRDKLRVEADFYRSKADPDLVWIANLLDLKAAHVEFTGATSAADYQDRVDALLRADLDRIEAERQADARRAEYEDAREAAAMSDMIPW